jgi:rhamnosyltransferase
LMGGAAKVSVFIPTYNAGAGFRELLEKISEQEGDFECEIVVVDSGSTDGTVELAQRCGATVHRIPKARFNHGATRNLGISLARGEYVALTVQDAVPFDERWLAPMVEDLEADEQVAVVYGRHVPRPESSVLTRALVNNLEVASLERREQEIQDPEQYRALHPVERRRIIAFDNVSSCLRRSVWEEFSFEKTNFAEDMRWGKKAVERGYKIVYEPRSVIVHSHERGALYDLRRHYVDQLALVELFGEGAAVPKLHRLLLTIPFFTWRVYCLLRREEGADGRALRLVLLAAKFTVSTRVGVYLGGKSQAIARLNTKLHARLHRFLSKGV